jgi:nicotinamide riboside transporter PnuC
MNILSETFGIITTILAIVGVFYNNRLNRKCFYFWIISNTISCMLHLYAGLWSLAIRDAIFLAFAFEGLQLWSWRPKHRGSDELDKTMRKLEKELDRQMGI